ncbi:MAG: hypothetical protein ACYTHJ_21740 [Planctomycetota bacterium]|jgi:hypothetical protein
MSPKIVKFVSFVLIAAALPQLAAIAELQNRISRVELAEHLPLIWLDDNRINIDRTGFGISSYVGDYRTLSEIEGARIHESIATMGSVLGATLIGIDKTRGEYNWVEMCEQYYCTANGENLVLNKPVDRSGSSFWYETFPHILFYSLADRYPEVGRMDVIVDATAQRWYEACVVMTDHGKKPDFNHTAFKFSEMKPVDNGRWTEPGSAGSIGWIQYVAYRRAHAAGDEDAQRFLDAADWCMRFLDDWPTNPYYEVQLLFGVYTAARMNAELDRDYDVDKLINWCFDRSVARQDMIMIAERWADHDVHGLMGSRRQDERGAGGYAFVMNTYVTAWPIVPVARYDDRYARAIGKWMLNASNASRLFYANAHPPARQSSPDWKGDPGSFIAYEGIRNKWHSDRPEEVLYASGDPLTEDWGPIETDFGLYGSAFVGVFGAMIAPTNDEKILQIDLLATDFYRDPAYPTFLYFNPYAVNKEIQVNVGDDPLDVYDCVANRFVLRGVTGRVCLSIPADRAVVAVLTPASGKVTREGGRTLVDGVVIDYRDD